MWKITLSLLLAVGLLGTAVAEDETPAKELKRGFADGKFVDEYFGIRYAAEGLKEGYGFGTGGNRTLWSGKLPGNVDVEILCQESAQSRSGAEWRAKVKEVFAKDGQTRTEVQEGDDPVPWISFVQESLAGFERHHGYAFYARGNQCFVVHVQVREKSETSGEAIRKAMGGLVVDPKSDSMLYVHLIAKGMQRPVTDPVVNLRAGGAYLQENNEIPAFAIRALELAQAHAADFSDDETWTLYQTLGLAQLKAGQQEASIDTWKKVIDLSAKTGDPKASLCNAQYNLACAYSLLGRLDEAFAALRASFEAGGEAQVAELKQHAKEDPDLEKMRQDPRWVDLVG